MTSVPTTTTVGITPPVNPRKRRIEGVDAARALAILGMMMVHFGPYLDGGTWATDAYGVTYGRASTTFVFLAGIGLSLLTKAKTPGGVLARVGWRVVVFLPLGFLLQMLPHPVAVILQYYAIYFVVGAAVTFLPTVALFIVASVWLIVGPLVYTLWTPPFMGGPLSDLLLTGFYPVIVWAPPFLVGMLVGRTDLRNWKHQLGLLVGGVLIAVLAYGGSWLAINQFNADPYVLGSEGHSGTPLNVLGATAIAVSVTAICLLITSAVPKLMWPLVATGQLALTIYVGHLFLYVFFPSLGADRVLYATRNVLLVYVPAMIGAMLWRWAFPRGPLETLLALPFMNSLSDLVGAKWVTPKPLVAYPGVAPATPPINHALPQQTASSGPMSSQQYAPPVPLPGVTEPVVTGQQLPAGLPDAPPVLGNPPPIGYSHPGNPGNSGRPENLGGAGHTGGPVNPGRPGYPEQ